MSIHNDTTGIWMEWTPYYNVHIVAIFLVFADPSHFPLFNFCLSPDPHRKMYPEPLLFIMVFMQRIQNTMPIRLTLTCSSSFFSLYFISSSSNDYFASDKFFGRTLTFMWTRMLVNDQKRISEYNIPTANSTKWTNKTRKKRHENNNEEREKK